MTTKKKTISFNQHMSHKPSALPSKNFQRLTSNPTISLEKQMSWTKNNCCEKRQLDYSYVLKLEYKVLPVFSFLVWKTICHLEEIEHKLLTAYAKKKQVRNQQW